MPYKNLPNTLAVIRHASDLFVTRLDCSQVREQYYCNFGIRPDKTALIQSGELRVTGSDPEGQVRVAELPAHPFFIGTLFVPQLRSTLERPHPLVTAFVRTSVRRAC